MSDQERRQLVLQAEAAIRDLATELGGAASGKATLSQAAAELAAVHRKVDAAVERLAAFEDVFKAIAAQTESRFFDVGDAASVAALAALDRAALDARAAADTIRGAVEIVHSLNQLIEKRDAVSMTEALQELRSTRLQLAETAAWFAKQVEDTHAKFNNQFSNLTDIASSQAALKAVVRSEILKATGAVVLTGIAGIAAILFLR